MPTFVLPHYWMLRLVIRKNASLGIVITKVIGPDEKAVGGEKEGRRFRMLETGQYDAKSLATTVVPLQGMLDAYEQVAHRTTVTAILTP